MDINALKQAASEAEEALAEAMRSGDHGAVVQARQHLEQVTDELIRAARLIDAPARLEEAKTALIELAQEQEGVAELLDTQRREIERHQNRLAEIEGIIAEATQKAADELLDPNTYPGTKPVTPPADLVALYFERDALKIAIGRINQTALELHRTVAAYPERLQEARRQFILARREALRAELLTALEPLMPLLARASLTEHQVRPMHEPRFIPVELSRDLLTATQEALQSEIPA